MADETEKSGCAGRIIFGVVVIAVLLMIVRYAKDDSPPTVADQKTTARLTARTFVLDKLVSPATAKFSPEWETEIRGDGDRWIVIGWVDSQNIYGGFVRQLYRVRLKPAENEMWRASEVLVVDR